MKKTTSKASSKKAVSKPAPTPTKAALTGDNLSLDQVKELIELISEKQFTEFELERGSFRMRLGRGTATKVLVEAAPSASTAAPQPAQEAPSTVAASTVSATAPLAAAPAEENLHIVTSPIVGTFYQAASPTNPPFAEIGATIQSGQTLCIVEAMKLMNEIQSDVSGTVAKISKMASRWNTANLYSGSNCSG
jgi:acetyl-CoA carboxylase biotin carboxyl carrier protein